MDQVSEIRNKTDLVALIQSVVPLKKMGANFKGLCPFHGEKTPSFVVSPERQIWHCFGCSLGGDAFSFLMEYERIEFPEALRILAEKTGVKLERRGFDSKLSSKKETLYILNHLAMEYYHFILLQHSAGKQALSYLTETRKINRKTIETFHIGFAPKSGSDLAQYLIKKKGYTERDLIDAGLATKKGNRLFDFFQGRLIFPLFDHRNNVIGFSGRVLEENQFGGKYINTKETLVYHKGSVFFGLNLSREAIKKEDKVIVMEGEFDVISAFEQGIDNTVAVKGTALTKEHVDLLARFAQNVLLCFDGDSAGWEATKRSLPLLEQKGLHTAIVVIPNGKDPDESIKNNAIAFKNAVRHAASAYDVLLDRTLSEHDAATAEGKQQISEAFLPMLTHVANEIVKDHYVRLLSQKLEVSESVVEKELEKYTKKEVIKNDVVAPQKAKRDREDVLEEYLLAIFVQAKNPSVLFDSLSGGLDHYVWRTPSFEKIFTRLKAFAKTDQEFLPAQFLAILPQELQSAFDVCFLFPLPILTEEKQQEEVVKIAKDLKNMGLKKDMKKLTEEITKFEKEGNEEKVEELEKKLQEIAEGI